MLARAVEDSFSIANHVHTCLDGFQKARSSLAKADITVKRKMVPWDINDELGRLRLWCGNCAAHRRGKSSLDYKLREASHIRDRVIELLTALDTVIQEAIEIINGERVPWEDVSDSESDMSDDNAIQEVGSATTELQQLASNMAEIITCLMRLSIAFRNPAPHDQFKESANIDINFFETFDIEHVRGKFPKAEEYLAVRLGKAISRRRQYLRYRGEHRKKLEQGLEQQQNAFEKAEVVDPVVAAAPTEEIQSTVASSIPEAVKASGAARDLDEHDYYEDTLSQTSYASSAANPLRLRPPSLPEEGLDGQPFECPLCFRFTSVRQVSAWYKHVYRDLHPYVCSFEDCEIPDVTYETRHDWFNHEMQAHRKWWECIEGCNLSFPLQAEFREHMQKSHTDWSSKERLDDLMRTCERSTSMDTNAECALCEQRCASLTQLRRHLGRHHEELALFALPSHMKDDHAESVDERNSNAETRSLPSTQNGGEAKVVLNCSYCGQVFDDEETFDVHHRDHHVVDNSDPTGRNIVSEDHVNPVNSTPCVTTNIRGQAYDITDLGIDKEDLEAVHEDDREELLIHQLAERRNMIAQQRPAGGNEYDNNDSLKYIRLPQTPIDIERHSSSIVTQETSPHLINAYCINCSTWVAKFTNSWFEVAGSSYWLPTADYESNVKEEGAKGSHDAINAFHGYQMRIIACPDCRSFLGFKATAVPSGRELHKGKVFFDLTHMTLVDPEDLDNSKSVGLNIAGSIHASAGAEVISSFIEVEPDTVFSHIYRKAERRTSDTQVTYNKIGPQDTTENEGENVLSRGETVVRGTLEDATPTKTPPTIPQNFQLMPPDVFSGEPSNLTWSIRSRNPMIYQVRVIVLGQGENEHIVEAYLSFLLDHLVLQPIQTGVQDKAPLNVSNDVTLLWRIPYNSISNLHRGDTYVTFKSDVYQGLMLWRKAAELKVLVYVGTNGVNVAVARDIEASIRAYIDRRKAGGDEGQRHYDSLNEGEYDSNEYSDTSSDHQDLGDVPKPQDSEDDREGDLKSTKEGDEEVFGERWTNSSRKYDPSSVEDKESNDPSEPPLQWLDTSIGMGHQPADNDQFEKSGIHHGITDYDSYLDPLVLPSFSSDQDAQGNNVEKGAEHPENKFLDTFGLKVSGLVSDPEPILASLNCYTQHLHLASVRSEKEQWNFDYKSISRIHPSNASQIEMDIDILRATGINRKRWKLVLMPMSSSESDRLGRILFKAKGWVYRGREVVSETWFGRTDERDVHQNSPRGSPSLDAGIESRSRSPTSSELVASGLGPRTQPNFHEEEMDHPNTRVSAAPSLAQSDFSQTHAYATLPRVVAETMPWDSKGKQKEVE